MRTLKSIGAILVAILVNIVLSAATDLILESSGVMVVPFVHNPVWIILLVLLYRAVYMVASGYIVALLAPRNPMKHGIILGITGTLLGIAGAIATWEMAPAWFQTGLVLLAFPCSWLGARIKLANDKR